MPAEAAVTSHYARRDLVTAIGAGLEALGKSKDSVSIEDLTHVDEFHIGGRVATSELGERLDISDDTELLDLGCGIGGAARFYATEFGCEVTGVDLTPEYVATARTLTEWTGLSEAVRFRTGSVVDLPFEDASFDCATQLHLGMNIEDKDRLFAEARRVLRPGGKLGVYDILRLKGGDIRYPVPWATDASTSFVDDLQTYRDALERAGFRVTAVRERKQLAVAFFESLRGRVEERGGPPPIGLHLVMGEDAPRKVANMVDAVTAGTVAPVEIIAHRQDAEP